jgi:hypothetical protein
MRSHAIPMRLLKEFAYFEPRTKSLRLWRYQRGIAPIGSASPKSETRIDGYFSKPSDSTFEENIEKTLADKVENDVHTFLPDLSNRFFVFSDHHKRALTRYIALLFIRCPGEKLAVRAHIDETRRRVAAFIENEDAFLKYALKVSIKEKQVVSPQAFKRAYNKMLSKTETVDALQEHFADMLDRWKEFFDYHLYLGHWNILHSVGEQFIIGDNPVVTWKMENGNPSFGVGLHVPGAEVFLPVSPTACLQILPAGCTRPIVSRPTPMQVNEAQVMFMTNRVFAKDYLTRIDELVQRKGGAFQIGFNCFLPPRNDEADALRALRSI